MKKRCDWAKDEPNMTYHDEEWGVPEHDDQKLFEFLILEGAQAGLSWSTILNRRDGYCDAFSNFDVVIVSKYTQNHVKKLVQNKAIIRNKLKINSAINNAKKFIEIQKQFGSFDEYLWGFVNHKTINNKFKKHSDLPACTTISENLSNDLKKRGFTFVGPIICYALMQAVGMVNDHTVNCFKYCK
ncbi:MAG: DNA-3-methyladenine glycosylase I [Nitrosopumilus sp.]|jgi:DNA-3-methyladenine glycosylase I|nr:DNA-3-methyladenine glycosylase I [Nitrosopumilus sp.]